MNYYQDIITMIKQAITYNANNGIQALNSASRTAKSTGIPMSESWKSTLQNLITGTQGQAQRTTKDVINLDHLQQASRLGINPRQMGIAKNIASATGPDTHWLEAAGVIRAPTQVRPPTAPVVRPPPLPNITKTSANYSSNQNPTEVPNSPDAATPDALPMAISQHLITLEDKRRKMQNLRTMVS
jgi:hypothetical protein